MEYTKKCDKNEFLFEKNVYRKTPSFLRLHCVLIWEGSVKRF